MATPISELIAIEVKTRLGLVDADSGYETTVSSVVRPTKRGGFHPSDYQIVVTQGDQQPNYELSAPGNPPAQAWDLPFIISCLLRPSDKSLAEMDQLRNEFAADVIKALTSGTSWWQFDGNSINANIGAVSDYTPGEEGESGGFTIVLEVTYRTAENDPYTARC